MTIILLPFTIMKYALFLMFGILVGILKIIKSFFTNSDMTGHEYEHYVADYLSFRGYHHVKVTKGSGDYGVDVIATKGGIKYAVQCKFYSNPVGIHAVQEAAAGKAYYGCDSSMVVTNNTFTKAAKELAEANGVALLENVTPTKKSKFFSGAIILFLYAIFLSTISAIMTEQHGALTTQDKILLGFGFAIPIIVAIWKTLKRFGIVDKIKYKIKSRKENSVVPADTQDSEIPVLDSPSFDETEEHTTVVLLEEQETIDNNEEKSDDVYIGDECPVSNIEKPTDAKDLKTIIEEITARTELYEKERKEREKKKALELATAFDKYIVPEIDILSSYENGLKELIENTNFLNESPLSLPIGKDFDNNTIFCDLEKAPHLKIIGASGSGKSILIHSMLISLLLKARPDEIKILIIDPKGIEFSKYAGIPHLLVPVITNPQKAIGALGWIVSEMQQRYNKFAELQVRSIDEYNKQVSDNSDIMPRICVLIDGLSDIRLFNQKETDNAINQLTQMSRAAGIHLVVTALNTTTLKKANINSSIEIQINMDFDSNEYFNLLTYKSNSRTTELHACYISDDDVSSVCDFVKNQFSFGYNEATQCEIDNHAIPFKLDEKDELTFDPLFEKAAEIVIEAGEASAAFLQRKLGLGYARSAIIIDQLEEHGVIGKLEGGKTRMVLMTKEMWIEKKWIEEKLIENEEFFS